MWSDMAPPSTKGEGQDVEHVRDQSIAGNTFRRFDETAGLDPRRWRALPIILIGSFLAFLDFFIVNIALPAMRADLSASSAQLQFIVAAYGISFGVSLITGGRLGDIFGRKRVFLIGLSGFTIASVLCGLSPTPEALIVSRVAQAICAATVRPVVGRPNLIARRRV
jgi:predicted MFS family arabinose efflux permease